MVTVDSVGSIRDRGRMTGNLELTGEIILTSVLPTNRARAEQLTSMSALQELGGITIGFGVERSFTARRHDFEEHMSYSETDQTLAPVSEAKPQARQNRRSWFFVCMASVLLVIVAVGFAKSFYLRNIIHSGHPVNSTLPVYIVLHGVALTSWFLLFLSQTLLVASGRVRLHRERKRCAGSHASRR